MKSNITFDGFSVLQSAIPFRTIGTVKRAYQKFPDNREYGSLRAISVCSDNFAEMWQTHGKQLFPLLAFELNGVPWYKNPKKAPPKVYVRNAHHKFTLKELITEKGYITIPENRSFFSNSREDLDIGAEIEWRVAVYIFAQDT